MIQSRWVREHAAWAYEVAQQERSCREVYREALQTRDLFRISAVFEQMKPALSPTAQWWHRKIEKEEFGEDPQDIDPKLVAARPLPILASMGKLDTDKT